MSNVDNSMAACAILSNLKCFLCILSYLYNMLELEFTVLYQSEGVLVAPHKTSKGKRLSIPSNVCQ